MILPLAHQQNVQLRRRNRSRVLIAAELRGAGKAHPLDTIQPRLPVRAELFRSPAPDTIERIAFQSSQLGSTVVLAGDVHTRSVLSAEYRVNAHGIAGLRTRFGIAELQTITSLGKACALSDPILVQANALTGNGIDDVERGMLGSSTFKPSSIGLVWEQYNFSETDPTKIAVRVRNEVDISRLRQLGINMGIVDEPRTGVRIYWEEPSLPPSATRVAGADGAVTRQLRVDMSQLRAGHYALEIIMQQPACGEVRSSRMIQVVR